MEITHLLPAPVLGTGCFGGASAIPLEITEGVIQGARLRSILELLEVIIFCFYHLNYKQHVSCYIVFLNGHIA